MLTNHQVEILKRGFKRAEGYGLIATIFMAFAVVAVSMANLILQSFVLMIVWDSIMVPFFPSLKMGFWECLVITSAICFWFMPSKNRE